jgi:hypothetical protein
MAQNGVHEYEGEGEEEDYVELDLEKTLTWTGNAVSIQAGGEFRLPLIVPHPSVLAIQFEVEGGNDIEFSLIFQDDQEEGSSVVRAVHSSTHMPSPRLFLRRERLTPPPSLLS